MGNHQGGASIGASMSAVLDTVDPRHRMHDYHVNKHIVKLLMPVYYVPGKLTKEDIAYAKVSWSAIISGSSPNYINLVHTDKNFKFTSCKSWFQSIYFERLFDIHPLCRSMFLHPTSQDRFIAAFFGFVFTALSEPKLFKSRLKLLAVSHAQRGVKAIEYGIIGEVMFYTLRECLGVLYDKSTQHAWVRIFSAILEIMIPIACGYELVDAKAQASRSKQSDGLHAYSYKESTACPSLDSDFVKVEPKLQDLEEDYVEDYY